MADFKDNVMVGKWKILRFNAESNTYTCECQCDKHTIKDVSAKSLKRGTSLSCGCRRRHFIDDITGKHFGEWEVLGPGKSNGTWVCRCSCDNHTIREVRRCNLTNGKSQSCGCKKREKARATLMDRYGETISTKIYTPREEWQINTIESADALRDFIINYTKEKGHKPTFLQLSRELGVNRHNISIKIHSFELECYVDIDPLQSDEEVQLLDYIKKLTNCEVRNSVRNIISPYELDIYIPDKKIAIEYNGNYWHSDIKLDKMYHQNKTLACNRKGIRLIHIFEYEWISNKEKILDFLKDMISDNHTVIYGRNTEIKEIYNNSIIEEFCNYNHLQGYAKSEINISLCVNDEIVGIMTFGAPRFNNKYQYELVRMCFKSGTYVIGGAEKMFKYFIYKYNPESIISYCSIDKFTGISYSRLGFKVDKEKPLSEPNYVWVDSRGKYILTRYQTQKQKLIKIGLGKESQTEEEIMSEAGFYRVYDSGNLRLSWTSEVK